MLINQISRRQHFWMLVTSFWTHAQKKKSLNFSETALSFSVKVKLSTFVCISFVKVWQELRTRRAFDRCEGYELSLVTLWKAKKTEAT